MSSKILPALIILAGFASCTTAYKSTQTPDDVYFSPVREIKEDRSRDDDRNQADQQVQTIEDRDIPEVIAALHYASRKNVTLVAASGNEGISKVAYPARDPQVISVGATTFNGCLADYSNAGRGLDIVAPGGGQDASFSSNPTDKANCGL